MPFSNEKGSSAALEGASKEQGEAAKKQKEQRASRGGQ